MVYALVVMHYSLLFLFLLICCSYFTGVPAQSFIHAFTLCHSAFSVQLASPDVSHYNYGSQSISCYPCFSDVRLKVLNCNYTTIILVKRNFDLWFQYLLSPVCTRPVKHECMHGANHTLSFLIGSTHSPLVLACCLINCSTPQGHFYEHVLYFSMWVLTFPLAPSD